MESEEALIDSLHHQDVTHVTIAKPYLRSLTRLVCNYSKTESIETQDALSPEVSRPHIVRRLSSQDLKEHARKITQKNVDTSILSACVQLPSPPAICIVQDHFNTLVESAWIATVWKTIKSLNLLTRAPRAGRLLA
ncbi:aspartate racemase/maleate isomerase family protein [Alcaligenes phenolicus]